MRTPWWLPFGKVPEIDPHEFKRWLDAGRPVQIMDSRTGPEFRQGTVGQALHAPVTEMPAAMHRLPMDKDRPVVVLCLSGHRSRPGTRWLRERGFQAYSLKGGILAWRLAGFTLEKPDRES